MSLKDRFTKWRYRHNFYTPFEIKELLDKLNKKIIELTPDEISLPSCDNKFFMTYDLKEKTIRIESGNPTPQVVYSSMIQHWKDNYHLMCHKFPMYAITKYEFEVLHDWRLVHDFPEAIEIIENGKTYTVPIKITHIYDDIFDM